MGISLARSATVTRQFRFHLADATVVLVLVLSASCEREPSNRGKNASPVAGTRAAARAAARPGEYHISPRGLERIREKEAFIPRVYDDGVGNKTIGYGHMLRPGESYNGISQAEAQGLFAKDVARIVDPALDAITTPLTQNQIDALGSFIFNVGPGNFRRSVLQSLNRGDHDGVTAAMGEYTKGRNQRTGERLTLRGLLRRRRDEVALYRAPAGSVSLLFPAREWSRAARRLLANGIQLLREKPVCLLGTCRRSALPS